MIIQHQFPLGPEPKQNKSAGLILFLGIIAAGVATALFFNNNYIPLNNKKNDKRKI